jgi:hypothetical protein
MKRIFQAAALAAALTLGACGGGNDTAAEGNNVSDPAATEINTLENAAGTLENVADNATSENVAEAVGNQAEAVSNAAETLGNTTANSH